MVHFRQKGRFEKLENYLTSRKTAAKLTALEYYGQLGVNALRSATPKDSGETANSWYFKIERTDGRVSLQFCNSHINKGVPIAVILQYGHGTGTGGWVEGIDYINPALRPVFEEIANNAWKEVSG